MSLRAKQTQAVVYYAPRGGVRNLRYRGTCAYLRLLVRLLGASGDWAGEIHKPPENEVKDLEDRGEPKWRRRRKHVGLPLPNGLRMLRRLGSQDDAAEFPGVLPERGGIAHAQDCAWTRCQRGWLISRAR